MGRGVPVRLCEWISAAFVQWCLTECSRLSLAPQDIKLKEILYYTLSASIISFEYFFAGLLRGVMMGMQLANFDEYISQIGNCCSKASKSADSGILVVFLCSKTARPWRRMASSSGWYIIRLHQIIILLQTKRKYSRLACIRI